jgi:hypothetical protein
MDDLDSRNAGLAGQALPPGGNINEWQAGRAIRTWNENQLAEQNRPVSVPDFNPIGSNAPAPAPVFGAGSRMISFKGINPIVGLLLLIFVGAPYYYLSIPLWFALYPVAGSVTVSVYIGMFMYLAGDATFTDSGHFAAPAIIAFIVAWPATLFDQIAARNSPTYWKLRHVARIALIGLWAIYALSENAVFANHVHMANPQLPPLQWTSRNILLAICAMVVMQFWLSPRGSLRNTWNRIRGRSTGFVGVR